jgi:hypothetical protein
MMHAQPQGRDNEVVDDKNPLHIGPLPSAEAHANRSFLRKQLCKRSLSLSLSLSKRWEYELTSWVAAFLPMISAGRVRNTTMHDLCMAAHAAAL